MLILIFTPAALSDKYTCWNKVGRKLLGLLVKICFVVLPALTIGITVWKVLDGTIHLAVGEKEHTADTFTAWPILCALNSLFVLGFYFLLICGIE